MLEMLEWLENTALRGTIAVFVVLAIRGLLKRTDVSKKYLCLLWMIPYISMVLPVLPESNFSIWGVLERAGNIHISEETVSADSALQSEQEFLQELPEDYGKINAPKEETLIHTMNDDAESRPVMRQMTGKRKAGPVVGVWGTGVLLLVLYTACYYVKLRRRVACSREVEKGVFCADDIDMPFVKGIFRPHIYLPSRMSEEFRTYVICHERMHISRGDCVLKPVAYLITCLHWFHPAAWVAFLLMEKDMEMACDEAVVRQIGGDNRHEYARTLLYMTTGKGRMVSVPPAFAEGDIGERIRNVVKDKRNVKVWAIIALAIIIPVAAVLLTNPSDKPGKEPDKKPAVTEDEQEQSGFTQERDREALEQQSSDEKDKLKEKELQEQGRDEEIEESEDTEVLPFILGADAERIEITQPQITEATEPGADPPSLDYASPRRMIFHGYFGLFVYDRERGIVGAVDLQSIGCHHTQGDEYCEVQASKDGSRVYLHVMSSNDMYVYDVEEAALYRQTYTGMPEDVFRRLEDSGERLTPDYTVLRSDKCVVLTDGYHFLESGSGMIIDLCWKREDKGTMPQSTIYESFTIFK